MHALILLDHGGIVRQSPVHKGGVRALPIVLEFFAIDAFEPFRKGTIINDNANCGCMIVVVVVGGDSLADTLQNGGKCLGGCCRIFFKGNQYMLLLLLLLLYPRGEIGRMRVLTLGVLVVAPQPQEMRKRRYAVLFGTRWPMKERLDRVVILFFQYSACVNAQKDLERGCRGFVLKKFNETKNMKHSMRELISIQNHDGLTLNQFVQGLDEGRYSGSFLEIGIVLYAGTYCCLIPP